MEETKVRRNYFEEFGVESVAPNDDFAYWVTMKRGEKEKERRERFAREKKR